MEWRSCLLFFSKSRMIHRTTIEKYDRLYIHFVVHKGNKPQSSYWPNYSLGTSAIHSQRGKCQENESFLHYSKIDGSRRFLWNLTQGPSNLSSPRNLQMSSTSNPLNPARVTTCLILNGLEQNLLFFLSEISYLIPIWRIDKRRTESFEEESYNEELPILESAVKAALKARGKINVWVGWNTDYFKRLNQEYSNK